MTDVPPSEAVRWTPGTLGWAGVWVLLLLAQVIVGAAVLFLALWFGVRAAAEWRQPMIALAFLSPRAVFWGFGFSMRFAYGRAVLAGFSKPIALRCVTAAYAPSCRSSQPVGQAAQTGQPAIVWLPRQGQCRIRACRCRAGPTSA